MESQLEKIVSMGINIMSLAVWLGEDRKCSAAVVGLDLLLGLSMVRRCSLNRSNMKTMEARSLKELRMTAVTRCKQPMRSQVGKGSYNSVNDTTKRRPQESARNHGKKNVKYEPKHR